MRGILPELFTIIINEPSSTTFPSDKHQPGKLLELHQIRKQQRKQLRNKAWKFIAQYSLPQFILIIREFPDPLLLPKKPSDRNEEDVIRVLRHAYQNITQWLFYLTKCEERFLWWKPTENYKPWADLFVAQLKLAKAVYYHKESKPLCQLFTSPEHLWFWCQVAICKQNLKVMGLENPIPYTQIVSKQDFLERWNRTNKMRKDFEKTLEQGVISPTRSEWFEKLDRFLEGEAMRIAQVEASWNKKGGAWLEYTNAQERARDKVRHEKDLQCVSLYQFPDDKESRIHITGPHQKLPKPPKRQKRGFNPKR
ncbi:MULTISPECIES: hypothetical protein [unclassified Coleofasciculus]|uniref:hypothetical protein n=1 Tax=unclassified Coleofasciculus TaxID=2692782 RepID=UPI00187E9583|nr:MULTISPECIES: hypothetical protein [unclassified Coleofasciculus]MBE9126798.1 hypothetical protein [Coleofasciculus sp. LEGE 07081]MBE9150169.1 hypothetical protein [Coleofasciculus sp. LEGE 07092]